MKKLTLITLLFTGFISCTPDQVEIIEIQEDFSSIDIETLVENDPENGINIVFMGDGYLESDLDRTSGIYRMESVISYLKLFDTEPFSQFQDHFNAYIVYIPSSTNVIDLENPSATAFGSTLGNCASGNSCLRITYDEKINYYMRALKGRNKTEKDLVLLSVNNTTGGSASIGGGVAIYGRTNYRIMVHEIGHAFARLADEYVSYGSGPVATFSTRYYDNIDETGDTNVIKWRHFIGLDGYEDVGAFEGAAYLEHGIWRPEEESVMRSLHNTYFNAPSREAIVKKILELRGLPYRFEDFLEIDAISLDRKPEGNFIKEEWKPVPCGIIPEEEFLKNYKSAVKYLEFYD